jgi:4a-hydroxytetrahydrobiopterin dehydratase
MPKLDKQDTERALAELPGWSLNGDAIAKTFKHESFAEAIVFVNAVAHLAELMNHHPDVDIRYSTIHVASTTHDQGGITEKDVALARSIEEIRRKAGVTA